MNQNANKAATAIKIAIRSTPVILWWFCRESCDSRQRSDPSIVAAAIAHTTPIALDAAPR